MRYVNVINVLKKPFRELAIYTRNELSNMILRIPDEDPELQIVQILLKFTTPPTSKIGAYLDVESRCDVNKVKRICYKVTHKIEASLEALRL